MLQPNGQRVLEIIGKDAGSKGIILPEQMPAAIVALQAEVAREDEERKAAGDAPVRADHVSLRQRATPFIDMLTRCHQAGKEIVWGV